MQEQREGRLLIQPLPGLRATRASLSVETIGAICQAIRQVNPHVWILVDNCYGEFTQTAEPVAFGADIMAGSFIKNPGGGITPTGGYIAGRRDLVESAATASPRPASAAIWAARRTVCGIHSSASTTPRALSARH